MAEGERVQDTAPQTALALFARLGLPGKTVRRDLIALGLWEGDEPADAALRFAELLAGAADPAQALVTLARLAERRPEAWAALLSGEDLVRRAAVVAGASTALGDLVITQPDALTVLTGELQPWDADNVRRRGVKGVAEHPDAPARALARLQRRGLLRIAARDLLGLADTPTAAAELADLAAGVLGAALDHVSDELSPSARVALIAMGKLGGAELNYVSDVDVLFVHDGDLADATRVCERFLRLLGETTPDGRAYEVDANLRPEGRDGPLTRSLDAYEAYYDRWAKTWEFQALLKARPVAGDDELGPAFAELAGRYVWPDRLDPEAVDEIQRMKGVVESSSQVARAGARQLKLAPGGLRDIEFAVQLLQLVHGRHDESLRSPNTLSALAALARGGYVDDADAALFSDTYQFLRTVEHRLQIARLRRTHTVPVDDADRTRLARAVGFRDNRDAPALTQFDREYRRVQGSVRRLHEKLFYRPLLSRFAQVSADEQLVGGEARLAEEAARERLEALGFANPEGALAHLDALASGLSRRAQLFRTLLPAILPTLAETPDPDAGLASFRSLAERLAEAPFFVNTLRDNPPVAELLMRVLGHSRVVGEWLERQPEVFGLLADMSGLQRRLDPDDYRRLADGLLRRAQDADAAADSLRRLRRRELVRIAVRDLAGLAEVSDVAWELTGLAQACLEAGVGLAVPEGIRVAIIGLGKLGGAELGYASDLDVLLVFEPADAHEAAQHAAEGLLKLLSGITPEGQAFRVDLNLRPEGKDGPLARSLESTLAYYDRWGEDWELQMLTQARSVAGDLELGQAFCDGVAQLVYRDPPSRERLQAVRRMKARVERERTPARRRLGGVRRGDRIDLKLGQGGLADVEWTVQLLQLRHGGAHAELRRPGALAALAALGEQGLVGADDATWLREGYLLLSRLRNVLHLGGYRDSGVLPPGARDQERIARMLGYPRPGAQAFVEDLGRTMRRIRKVHERAFYDA
jgi:[glutamine synthetase] adenylyltransferase / [glutamine synthetase]-adenylyl-L-tyrosine phosphorylase